MIKANKIIYSGLTIASALAFPFAVSAQTVSNCGIFDFLRGTILQGIVCRAPDTSGLSIGTKIAGIVESLVGVVFILVLVIAVLYTLKAAISYIRSEGNEQKVEQAKNAVKAVLLGVGAMFVALLGMVVLSSLFNGDGTPGAGIKGNIEKLVNCTLGLADNTRECSSNN